MSEGDRAPIPSAGEIIAGRYRAERVLGTGGMGVVIGAFDQATNTSVALKLLRSDGHVNVERFLREARVSSRLESAHVVEVFDCGSFNGHPYIVMERLEGQDFGVRVKNEGPLNVMEVADCIVQACEALAHAHGTGIVHRDIKASNIFEHRRPDGTTIVKVLDFGISKFFARPEEQHERTLTQAKDGGFLGSPPYMSPEHVRDPRNVDCRADIWSLGIVVYRLLSGRFPFDGESTGEVLAKILENKAPRLRNMGLMVPEEIDVAIAHCLTRNRDDRFQNVAEVAAAFAPFTSPRWRSLHEHVADVVRAKPWTPPPRQSDPSGPGSIRDEPLTAGVAPPVSLSQPPSSYRNHQQPISYTGDQRWNAPPVIMPQAKRWPLVLAAMLGTALLVTVGAVAVSRRSVGSSNANGAPAAASTLTPVPQPAIDPPPPTTSAPPPESALSASAGLNGGKKPPKGAVVPGAKILPPGSKPGIVNPGPAGPAQPPKPDLHANPYGVP